MIMNWETPYNQLPELPPKNDLETKSVLKNGKRQM